MGAKNGVNTANGIMSAFVLSFGVCFCGLVVGLVRKAVQDNSELQDDPKAISSSQITYASSAVWSFGFAYIVPGLVGIISAFVKHKAAYITQMVFSIITLLVMGIIFVMAFYALTALTAFSVSLPQTCVTVGRTCSCSAAGVNSFGSVFDMSSSTPINYTCEDLRSMYAMGVAILIILVLAWILTLVTTILSGILACKREVSPGIVLHSAPNAQHANVQMGHMAMPPQVTYVPSANDQALLVNNMA